jgi:hypothetical protein
VTLDPLRMLQRCFGCTTGYTSVKCMLLSGEWAHGVVRCAVLCMPGVSDHRVTAGAPLLCLQRRRVRELPMHAFPAVTLVRVRALNGMGCLIRFSASVLDSCPSTFHHLCCC